MVLELIVEKHCIECHYCIKLEGPNYYCESPNVTEETVESYSDIVTGEKFMRTIRVPYDCRTSRQFDYFCGHDAKWFRQVSKLRKIWRTIVYMFTGKW